mgnify:CR=1 FL=1
MGSKYEGIVMSAGSTSYTFDAENRMVSVSGAAAATFVYDGDGNRVKGVVGGVTTTYIGNYFEWSGSTSTMKKYYYAGGTRVAERKGTTLYWLLSDHLGSTSITATSSGSKTAELRINRGERHATHPGQRRQRFVTRASARRAAWGCTGTTHAGTAPRWAGSCQRIRSFRSRGIRRPGIGMGTCTRIRLGTLI